MATNPAALCQEGCDAGQHIGHHLRLYAKENYIAVLRDHIVGGGAAAKCVRMNSCGKRRDIEQINIVMTCVRKAVRESRKTRMMMGSIAYGIIYTLNILCDTMKAVTTL